jgi:cysteine desulfurase
VGFARAVELCVADLDSEAERIRTLREQLWSRLAHSLDGVERNGHPERRLPGNLNVSFAGVEADQLLVALPEVALSSGSACASASGKPSPVLRALGLSEEVARTALRFGIGRINTEEEIAWVADRVIEAVGAIRRQGAVEPRREPRL